MAKKKSVVDNKILEQKAMIEGIRLVMRLYIFSVAPLLLTFLLSGINMETGELNINWMVFRNIFLFQTITFILAGMDRYKHVYLKSKDPVGTEGKSMGIVKI